MGIFTFKMEIRQFWDLEFFDRQVNVGDCGLYLEQSTLWDGRKEHNESYNSDYWGLFLNKNIKHFSSNSFKNASNFSVF